MAPVLIELRNDPQFEPILVATAQQREMLDQTLEAFGLVADVDLDLMHRNQTPNELFARTLTAVQATLKTTKPDIVLVHGDTTTCLASAIAAFHESIPIGHVEAGLRTHDLSAPWPEEMNRRLTDPISNWCFAPTDGAAKNLRREGIADKNIFVTGNTSIDALLLALSAIDLKPPQINGLPDGIAERYRVVLVTGHRRESFGKPLADWCVALRDIVMQHPDVAVVYPVHLNPRVDAPVRQLLAQQDRIFLTPPLEYVSFISLFARATLLLTDSGGIQEEAPTLRKPVLVMRQITERPEAVEHGVARVIGTQRDTIVNEVSRLLTDPVAYASMITDTNPFGDGKAAHRIVGILRRTLFPPQ